MAIDIGLQGKPWYFGFGIGALLAVLLVVGTHYLFITDINEGISRSNSRLDELTRKIEAGRSAEKKLPQFREEVKRLELELEKLRRILPSNRNTEEIIKKIKALVDQGDFQLRSLVFPRLGDSANEESIVEWPISVSVDGGYHNLAILFNRLSNFTRIMNVEQFTINALGQQDERTISADFVAKTFVYIEPQGEEAPAAGGAPGGQRGGRR